MRSWNEMCLDHMEWVYIKEKITLIWQTDKHLLFPRSWWGTTELRPDWCAVAAGSSERLKDSMRCMKSFRFSYVSTPNGLELDKSWKFSRKKKKRQQWRNQPGFGVCVDNIDHFQSRLQYVWAQKWLNVSDYVLISPCLAGTFLPQTFNFL